MAHRRSYLTLSDARSSASVTFLGSLNEGNCVSERLVIFVSSVTSMIIVPLYSAAILSFIMLSYERYPFRTLDELAEQEGYTVAGLYGTFSSDFMTVRIIFLLVTCYTLSEAWSGVNWADLMAAQGAFGTDVYDRSTRTIVGTMLWTDYRPVLKIGPKGALGSQEIRPIYSAPSLGQSILVQKPRMPTFF